MDNSFSCDLFSKCSGCTRQVNVKAPDVWEEIYSFFQKISPLKPELVSREITAWRSKAKLAVRGNSKNPQIGLFEKGSHKVVNMEACPLHYMAMDEALEGIRNGIKEYKVEPYQEEKHQGRLRYLQMHISRKTLKIQLALVFKAESLEENEKVFVKRLYNTVGFHSIWANYLPEKTNSVFGSSWELLEGEEDFFQEIKGISFAFHPSCFSQTHLFLFDDMISYIDSLVGKRKRVLELYAGVGCIGLSLANNAKKVTLVESSPLAEKCFEKTLEKLSSEIKRKCYFLSAKVEEVDISLRDVDVILVDPPRKGLSRECKEKIFGSTAKQLIYISCGHESFMRDCFEILEQNWELESAMGYLLFPGTNHVEIVASFQR